MVKNRGIVRCVVCGDTDLSKFGMAGGRYKTICKSCHAERERNRRKLPSGRDAYREACRRYYENNREAFIERRKSIKHLVRQSVIKAIGEGILVRPNRCSECTSVAFCEGHHDDYSKPLDVRWLCISCHQNHHKKARSGLGGKS